MESFHQRKERFYLKLLFGALLGIFLLIGLIWCGHDLYARWQERRLFRRAVVALQHGDDATASLAARAILELNPTSASAARIMAELAEHAGERSALDWRRKVAQLDPQSVDDALALVRSAVRFNDLGTAERGLASVPERARTTAPYHEAAARLAQAKHQDDQAETEWNEALRLRPNDKSFQVQLGGLRTVSNDPQRRAEGEAMLNALRSDPAQRSAATRALINGAIARHEDAQNALNLARELQEFPEATWNDRLLYLDLLHAIQDPKFSSYLTELEKEAVNNPGWLTALLSWMTRSRLNLLALDYINTLPLEAAKKWPTPVAVGDVYVKLDEWQKLEALTAKAQWGHFDFLRHAYLARALREQGQAAAAQHEWVAASKQASEQSDFLSVLIQTTSEWKWENESTELLWSLSKRPEKQQEALLALYRSYARAADTQGLYRVLHHLADADGNNLDVLNNLAQVSLLLNVNLQEARRVAADAYRKAPTNPAYVSTYAYSRLSQGNAKEALRIMSSLTEEQLSDPSISAYYGICLAANGDEKARAHLEFGKKANLLPEEKALVDKALANLNSWRRAQ